MNYFSVLGMEERPLLAADSVRQRHLELTATEHPDISQGDDSGRFSEINQAVRILQSDKLRLKHLLELQGDTLPSESSGIPDYLAELFMKAGTALRRADGTLKSGEKAESQLERMEVRLQAMELVEELETINQSLNSHREKLEERLRLLDERWLAEKPVPEQLEELKALQGEFSFLDRWREQLGEKSFKLAGVI